jgi:ABC-2 type transport system ATP-binding protein
VDAVCAIGLGFTFPGGRRALDEVSFTIAAGELFGFLGPNGGGKSTLFHLLATRFRPSAGRVTVGGHDLAAAPAAVRRELGVVFQSPSLDLELTVAENLRHQGHLYGLAGRELARRIDEGLDRFDLTARRDERAKTLSGGLRRRAELAKALLHRPRVLLLDEPSTGLDPGARHDLRRHLRELSASGVTVLLTTHFIDEAEDCHRVGLLDSGRLVALGRPEALVAEIGGDVISLTSSDPTALAEHLTTHFPDITPTVSGTTLRFEHARAHELVPRLAEAFPGRIQTLTVARPTLEDVFLHETGRRLNGPEAES